MPGEKDCLLNITYGCLHSKHRTSSQQGSHAITRFSNLQHAPLSLDCLIDSYSSFTMYFLKGFIQPLGDFPVAPIPDSPSQQSSYIFGHYVLYQPVFRMYCTRVCLLACWFFTKPAQLTLLLGLPSKAPGEFLVRCSHTPYIFHHSSDYCISPLIFPQPHFTSGQIAKDIVNTLL